MAWPSARFKTAAIGGDWTPGDMNSVQDHFLRAAGITPDDLALAAIRNLGLTTTASGHGGAVVRRGYVNIPTSQARSNTAYGTLTTPDQIANVVLPTNGLIVVAYQATWSESVKGAARAAIFLNANQVRGVDNGFTTPQPQEAAHDAQFATQDQPLFANAGGLYGGVQTAGWTDSTTGQILGGSSAEQVPGSVNDPGTGGPCYLFAAAGTYTVSIQFKASSGSVTARNRQLWVWTLGFE